LGARGTLLTALLPVVIVLGFLPLGITQHPQ
jgi:hypothetical protein